MYPSVMKRQPTKGGMTNNDLPCSFHAAPQPTRSYRKETTRPAGRMNTQPLRESTSHQRNSASRDGPLLYTPSQGHTTLRMQDSTTKSHTQQRRRDAPSKEKTPNLSTRATGNSTSSPQLIMNSISTNLLGSLCQLPASEKPGWLFRFSARKVLFQPRNRIFSPRVSKPSSQARKLSPKQFFKMNSQ
jgi:hypothetical protein